MPPRVSSPDIRANVGAQGVVFQRKREGEEEKERERGELLVLQPVYAAVRMFAVLVRLISRFSCPRSGPIEVEKLNVCDNAPAMLLPTILLSLSLFLFVLSFTVALFLFVSVSTCARFVASWNAGRARRC